jgi:hypothetical protein
MSLAHVESIPGSFHHDEASEPFIKHSRCFGGPKNPSAPIRSESKLCGKSSAGSRAPIRAPKNPSQNSRASIEPPWKPSTSLCAIVRVRGPGRSRASLHQASGEPGVDLRKTSKLRRARQLTAVRISVLVEPLDERLIRIRHPKRPSTVHRPISESRSEPLSKLL